MESSYQRAGARLVVGGEEWEHTTVSSMTAKLSYGRHDSIALACTSSELTTVDGMKGQPVVVIFGRGATTESIYGYISSATDRADGGVGRFPFSLDVYGATFPMSTDFGPDSWRNRTTYSVLSELTARSNLGFYGEKDDTFAWLSLAHTQGSSWAWLLSHSEVSGLTVFNHLGVVSCINADKLFSTQGAYLTLIGGSRDSESEGIGLESFESTDEAMTDESVGISVSFFQGTNVSVYSQRGYDKHRHWPITVRSLEEARRLVDSFDQKLSRWRERAVAVVEGNARLRPGLLVDVVQNANYYNPSNGKWMVAAVDQVLENEKLSTQLKLARPNSDGIAREQPFVPFWQERGRPSMSIVPDTDLWRSSWQRGVAA